MSVGIRLASAITGAGSRDRALAVSAKFLAVETGGGVAAWRRSETAMIFVAAEGFEREVRRTLVAATSPWRGADRSAVRQLERTFATIVGSRAPTLADLGVGCILLAEECPEIEASRAELANAIASLPDVDPVILLEDVGSRPLEREAFPLLTHREREILDLIVEGMSTGRIAERLVISTKTVKTHVQHILTKLGVGSRLEAAALVRGAGSPAHG
jgi:DNA-binding CsgD family transcriptional regulator